MMEFPMVNNLLNHWKRSVVGRSNEIYHFDLTINGITQRIEILRQKDSRCYLVDYCIINRFNVKKQSHLTIMKEALEDVEFTIDELKQKGLEER